MPRQHRLLSDLAAIEQQLTQMAKGANLYTAEQGHGTWLPAVDIFETPSGFVLTAELPGVALSDLDVRVVDDHLILRGKRRWTGDVQGEQFYRLESAYGQFERSFTLSERIDVERITTRLEQGVLKLALPKSQK